ncbi:MAG: hypothetical protein ACP5IG_04755 [Candidatus Micrarchaeia archaeon]
MRLEDKKKAELYLIALLRQKNASECPECRRLQEKERNSKNRPWTASNSELEHCLKEVTKNKQLDQILSKIIKENENNLNESKTQRSD